MDAYHNDPNKFIDDPEYFGHYRCWLLREYEGTNIYKSINRISNALMDGGSNSHVLNEITMLTYIIPVNCNV